MIQMKCDKWELQSGYGAEVVSGSFSWYSITTELFGVYNINIHIKGWDLNKHIDLQSNPRLKNEKCHFIAVHPGKN
jgi:hypothetical protein